MVYSEISRANLNILLRLLEGNLRLDVAADEKLQEQEEVAAVHDKGGNVVLCLNVALRISLEEVESSQSDRNAHNHLRNLHRRDNNGVQPTRLQSHRHQKVVAVHAGMNRVVHGHKENTRWRLCNIRVPAVQQDRDVVIPMQENELLLVNDNEKCVNQLTVIKVRAPSTPATAR